MIPTPESHTAPGGAGRIGAYVLLAVLLIVAWVLWSGMFKPLLLWLGAFSCALTVYLAGRMGYFDARIFALRFNLRLLAFWGWLLAEIFRSCLQVVREILSRDIQLSTHVVELDANDLDSVEQVVLGNSITLTPGTLTLDVSDGRLLVHALTPEGAEDVAGGNMKRRVAGLRGD